MVDFKTLEEKAAEVNDAFIHAVFEACHSGLITNTDSETLRVMEALNSQIALNGHADLKWWKENTKEQMMREGSVPNLECVAYEILALSQMHIPGTHKHCFGQWPDRNLNKDLDPECLLCEYEEYCKPKDE